MHKCTPAGFDLRGHGISSSRFSRCFVVRGSADLQCHVAQAAFVNSFGAGKPDSTAMNELLKKAPLPHKDQEVWFKALACIPDLGPQIARKVSEAHASLGSLVATYHATAGWAAAAADLDVRGMVVYPQRGCVVDEQIANPLDSHQVVVGRLAILLCLEGECVRGAGFRV